MINHCGKFTDFKSRRDDPKFTNNGADGWLGSFKVTRNGTVLHSTYDATHLPLYLCRFRDMTSWRYNILA